MTGSIAHALHEIEFVFGAWDGYIRGANLLLDSGNL